MADILKCIVDALINDSFKMYCYCNLLLFSTMIYVLKSGFIAVKVFLESPQPVWAPATKISNANKSLNLD